MMAKTKLLRWLMGALAISLLALILPSAALANSGGEGTTVTVGGYQVSLVFAEPAKMGENPFHVQILNGMGMPVSGAQVEISAMPVEETQAHEQGMEATPTSAPSSGMSGMGGGMETAPTAAPSGGMSGMESAPAAVMTPETAHPVEAMNVMLKMGDTAGEYAGTIAFSAAGHWMLTAHLTIDGQTLAADFPVDVAGGSAGGVVLAGFAGLNVFIIGAAAVLKRKPISA